MRRRFQRLCHKAGIAVTVLAVCAMLAACAGWEPLEPPVAGEIPEGAGVFSGEDGEFVIFRR